MHFRPNKYEQFNQLLILTWQQQIRYVRTHLYLPRCTGIPETHTKRDRRPSTAACPACWAMGPKHWNSAWWVKRYFALGRLEQTKAGQKYLYQHDEPDELTKDEQLSFVRFESPFTSVSTVSRGHPSLAFLRYTVKQFYAILHVYSNENLHNLN